LGIALKKDWGQVRAKKDWGQGLGKDWGQVREKGLGTGSPFQSLKDWGKDWGQVRHSRASMQFGFPHSETQFCIGWLRRSQPVH